MKRWWALCLALALLFPAGALAEKAGAFPDVFRVEYKVKEREINGGRCFVSKEYVSTALPQVDEEINGLVDAFDDALSPLLTPDPSKNPKRNSRLDIHVGKAR